MSQIITIGSGAATRVDIQAGRGTASIIGGPAAALWSVWAQTAWSDDRASRQLANIGEWAETSFPNDTASTGADGFLLVQDQW